MKNIEILNKKLKTWKNIDVITFILILPILIGIGVTAPKSTIIATILTVILIICIYLKIKSRKQIENIKEEIKQINIISKAIEDSK